jgi:hypothetical protein
MAKSAKTKTSNAITLAAGLSATSSRRAIGTDADIACRAYDLYLARGGGHGHDVEDWVRAERELRGPGRLTAA